MKQIIGTVFGGLFVLGLFIFALTEPGRHLVYQVKMWGRWIVAAGGILVLLSGVCVGLYLWLRDTARAKSSATDKPQQS